MKILFLVFLIWSPCIFAQKKSFLKFGVNSNINLTTPYLTSSNIKNSLIAVNADFKLYQRKKLSFFVGVNYAFTYFRVIDAIDSITYLESLSGNIPGYYESYIYIDKPDLRAKSHSLGISIEVNYLIKSQERFAMSLGFRPSVFFLEWYKAKYFSLDWYQYANVSDLKESDYVGPVPLITELPRNFFLSSINSQLIYRITLLPKTGRTTLTGKVSLGANIFSDWSQFKRYAWLGVGLEIGFLGKEK